MHGTVLDRIRPLLAGIKRYRALAAEAIGKSVYFAHVSAPAAADVRHPVVFIETEGDFA